MRWQAGLLLILVNGLAEAHPQHRSTAQVEVNRKTTRLEVGLRVHPNELSQAVARWGEPKGSREERITRYLLDRFQVIGEGQAAKLSWVGQEKEGSDVWLYFEIELPKGAAELTNRVFFEQAPNQINVVRIKDGKTKRTVSQTIDSKPLLIRGRCTPTTRDRGHVVAGACVNDPRVGFRDACTRGKVSLTPLFDLSSLSA